ncbi:MAG: tetratricopeptide repeat protein, partial [Candidatus Hydrogenedentes bacterium]|nr:tetratricopeptide repeat protein [Candidatus Hydrogenedentota bacterium]
MKRLALVIVVAVGTWAGAEEPDQAQMDFANGLFQRGLFKEAVEEYRAYLTQFPQGKYVSTALYRLGEAEYAGGNQSGALEAFDKLLGSPDLESAVQQQASARRGEVLYRLKRYDEARPVLEPLAAPELPPDVRARALYYLGKLHFDQNNPAEALNALKRLVDELPEHALAPYARFQVGFVYLALNDTQNAAIAFGEVAKSAPDAELRMESRFRAAEAYDKIGWYDAAAAAYEQLRQEFPDSVYAERAMYGHAWASYHAGKVENAAALAAEFLAKYTNSERTAGVKYLQANCQQQQKKYAEALELYRAIEAQFATSEFALRAKYKIAWAQYLNGNVQEAKTAIMEFLEKHKDSAWVGDASFLLGSILAAEGNFEDAYEEFRLVAEKYTA